MTRWPSRWVITTKGKGDELTLRHASSIRFDDQVSHYTTVTPTGWQKGNLGLEPGPTHPLRKRWDRLHNKMRQYGATLAKQHPDRRTPEAWDAFERDPIQQELRKLAQQRRKWQDEAVEKERKTQAKGLDSKPAAERHYALGGGQSCNGQALTKRLRVPRAAHVRRLNAIDQQIAKLQRQRKLLIVTAWEQGIRLDTPEKVRALVRDNETAAGKRDRVAFEANHLDDSRAFAPFTFSESDGNPLDHMDIVSIARVKPQPAAAPAAAQEAA